MSLFVKAFIFARKMDGHCSGFAISDSIGSYQIDRLDPGFYRLIAYAKDYSTAKYPDSVLVNPGEVTPDIDFHLKKFLPLPEGVIAGKVTDDSSGLPIPKALVLGIAFPDTNLPPFVRTTFSNEDGTYELAHLPKIPSILFAHAPKYLGEFYDNVHSIKDATPVTPDASNIDFALKAREVNVLSSTGGKGDSKSDASRGSFYLRLQRESVTRYLPDIVRRQLQY